MPNLGPGLTIGPYHLLTRIGGGGMGEVWKAHDTRLNRTVAIKSSHPQFRVYLVDPVSARWQAVTDLPLDFRATDVIGGVARLSVPADAKSVAVSVNASEGDIWILDGFQPPRTFLARVFSWK